MKKITICILISFLVALILGGLSIFAPYRLIESKLYDARMNLRPAPTQDKRILFIEMDEQAIDDLGRWPWPRDINAQLIETLKSLGARQVLFDVTFSNTSQLVIDKEKMNEVFKEKNIISDFIDQVSDGIKSGDIKEREDILWYLTQINDGIDAFRGNLTDSMRYAITDKDKILASALSSDDVFIGYKFEVIHKPHDIAKDETYATLKKEFENWIINNPTKFYRDLPHQYKSISSFSEEEKNLLFFQLKIRTLLNENIQSSVDQIAKALNRPKKEVRPEFNSIKKDLAEEKIISFLEENAQAKFTQVIWTSQIHDRQTALLFKKAWANVKKKQLFIEKIGRHIKTDQKFLKAVKLDVPIAEFTKAVNGAGFLNGIVDDDGVLRSVPLFIKYENKIYPHMAITSVINLLKPKEISFVGGKFCLLKGIVTEGKQKDLRIPIDAKATTLINWVGKWHDTFRHASCSDVYRLYSLRENAKHNANIPKEELTAEALGAIAKENERLAENEKKLTDKVAGSICIIGLTAAGTHDYNPIPQESAYPMLGTHANIINSILTEQFITKAPKIYDLAVTLILVILLGVVLTLLSSTIGLIFIIAVIAVIFYLSLFLFNHGIWINLTSPILLSLFSYLGITSYKFATEEKEKRWIKKAFSHYVSKEVIEEIIKDPSKLKLGGQRKVLTVLFSDIRSFTTYSEKRKPEEVVTVLNEYLDEMTKVIFANSGTLDKYVGDEIMALFGAPRYEPPDLSAVHAVKTACAMLEKLALLQEKWKAQGIEPLDIGIGINTGEMVVGNMGSSLVMDYTVIGDAVNLGARIEALTRQYNNHIIVSESTYEYIKDIVDAKPLEAIKVKGKNIPVMIYQVNGMKT
ncbi:MAG: CHASE2 domain-containing protein [Candidatus Omnitrophica bacterium]|nr:CHASE2 domain-containing protein [Candidatus Omnitrophota bacterium]